MEGGWKEDKGKKRVVKLKQLISDNKKQDSTYLLIQIKNLILDKCLEKSIGWKYLVMNEARENQTRRKTFNERSERYFWSSPKWGSFNDELIARVSFNLYNY